MRVLVLSASYGSGHNVAAQSVAAALEAAGASVTIVDHFRDLVHPAFDRGTRALYGFMLRRAPALWGIGYSLGDRMASDSPWAFGIPRIGARRLAKLLDTLEPDAVVSVHATPAVATLSAATLWPDP